MARLAEELELGPVEQQVQVPEFGFWEYADLRLQVLPDRLQLGFRQRASQDLVRRAVEEFVRVVRADFQSNIISFNANLALTIEEDEAEPTSGLLDASALAEKFQGSRARGGVWLIYGGDDSARWWIELIPVPDKARRWVFSVNRHYDKFPDDQDAQTDIFDWFQDAKARLSEQCEALMKN
jgi:hypothetical protein